ncbi:MAG: hypothetical protein LBQ55_07245 [Treponema sp.]|jgi:hypothetical protein|nr:hypothetical protein [Treponema sp.]
MKNFRIVYSIFFIASIAVVLNTCDLFQESLVAYLHEEPNQEQPAGEDGPPDAEQPPEEDEGPYVYVDVINGDDTNNSGWSEAEPVKTLGRALDIWLSPEGAAVWVEKGSDEAKIMLLEDLKRPNYTEAVSIANNSYFDFPKLLDPRPGITALTLAGAGGGKDIDNGGESLYRVLNINNAGTTITLKNLTVKGGHLTVYDGGGIRLLAGTLIAKDLVISGNQAPTAGGGVYMNGGQFTMTGGEIRNNTATNAGGKGAGVYVNGGSFKMESGVIWQNTADLAGGGVCVAEYGAFTMTGGTIKKNTSGNDGGGVYIFGSSAQPGKASITGGLIGASSDGEGNTAKYGGGVYVGNYGYLELGDLLNFNEPLGYEYPYPYIQHNSASGASPSTGGGLVINGVDAQTLFYHGTIGWNRAADQGGGILIVNGTLDMQGGTVKGNDASIGKGIMVEKLSTTITSPANKFIMRGYARVLEPDNPVYLDGSASPKRRITIGGSGFHGLDESDGIDIANVTAAGYGSGDTILENDTGAFLNQLTTNDNYKRFNVNGHGSISTVGISLDPDGKLP